MSVFITDRAGAQVELNMDNGLHLHREAADKKISFRQLVNIKYPTAAGAPEVFKQMCHSAGLRFKRNPETGQPASTIREALDPYIYKEAATTNQTGGTFTSQPGIPDSRILFMPALMAAVEDSLETKEGDATSAFESIVGHRESVVGTRVEQPVITYSGKGGPEDSRFSRIEQNSRPNVMLAITAADIARKIPTNSIGMTVSDEAMNNGLDVVVRTLKRFYKKADYAEWVEQIGYILSGSADAAVTPMDDGTAALPTFTAASLSSGLVNGIDQKAWLKYFYKNSMFMVPDVLVCDWNSMYEIENRDGRPTNVMNDSVDRMDIPYNIIYPVQKKNVNIIVMPDGTFPAKTIMGLMKEDAIAKITNSSAQYTAIEKQVLTKSTDMRFDRGFTTYRMYADAFSVMTYA